MSSKRKNTAALCLFISVVFIVPTFDLVLAGPKSQTYCWKRDDGVTMYDSGEIAKIADAYGYEKDRYGGAYYRTIKEGPLAKNGEGLCLIELLSKKEYKKLYPKTSW